jgi:hypothetical protein
MYGSVPYASTPYAAMGGSQLLVAACIHVDLQSLYTCTIGIAVVYTASIATSVCPCESTSGVC